MRPIDLATLGGVHGGMRLDRMRESTNVEDRRGEAPPLEEMDRPVMRDKRRG